MKTFSEYINEGAKYKSGTQFSFTHGSNSGYSLGYRNDEDEKVLFQYKGHHPNINQWMGSTLTLDKKTKDGWTTKDGYIIGNWMLDNLKDKETKAYEDIENQNNLDDQAKRFAKRFIDIYSVGDSFKAKRDAHVVYGTVETDYYGEDGTGAKKKPLIKSGGKKKITAISQYGASVSGFKGEIDWATLRKIVDGYGD